MDKYRIDSQKLIYHPHRIADWLDARNDWEKEKKIIPLYVEISPVGYCNHRCTFCALDFMGYKNKKLPLNILKDRLSEMSSLGVKSVMFAGEGEPLLYKNLLEVLCHCKDINIDTSLTTNMVLVTEENAKYFVNNCKWIKVSINAGNAEVYSRIHRTNKKDFFRVIDNIKMSVALKKDNNYSCTIGAQLLLLPDNYDTVITLADILKETGIDYLVVKPYSQHLSSITTIYREIDYSKYLYLQNELEKYQSDDFKIIFRIRTINKLIKDTNHYKKCNSVPFFWAYITAEGNVYGCSAFLGNEKFCYGNINENSFKDIWYSGRRKKGLLYVKNNLVIDRCRVNCRMDEVNRYLWELTNPVDHVNFI